MLVRSHAFAIQRGIAEHVTVELDIRAGLPAFSVIGLTPGAARDARERVQSAVLNSGLAFPRRRVTVNLAPASSRRSGPEFDLAIAVCVLAADGPIDPGPLARVGLFGELGLGGLLRTCASPAAAAAAAGEAALSALIVAYADAEEARAAQALPIVAARDLSQVIALLATTTQPWRRPGRPAAEGRAGAARPGTLPPGAANGRAQVRRPAIAGTNAPARPGSPAAETAVQAGSAGREAAAPGRAPAGPAGREAAAPAGTGDVGAAIDGVAAAERDAPRERRSVDPAGRAGRRGPATRPRQRPP